MNYVQTLRIAGGEKILVLEGCPRAPARVKMIKRKSKSNGKVQDIAWPKF